MGRPLGSQNKDKPYRDALRMVLAAGDRGEKLEYPPFSIRAIALATVTKALTGDTAAIREIGDRLDGKVPQAIVGDSEHDPIGIGLIERKIIDPRNSDAEGLPAAAGPEPV